MGSEIATGQTLQVVKKKSMAESHFRVQKKRSLREFSAFSQPFYQKRIKAMFIRGKCKFLSK